jgi:hypothetical protein
MKDHEYFVYIMCSLSGTLYIGMTNSIYRRALQHKRAEIEGTPSRAGFQRARAGWGTGLAAGRAPRRHNLLTCIYESAIMYISITRGLYGSNHDINPTGHGLG